MLFKLKKTINKLKQNLSNVISIFKIQKKEKQFEDEIGKNNKEIMTYMIKNKLKSEYSYEIIKELIVKRGDIKKFNISGINLVYSSKYFALCMQIRKFGLCRIYFITQFL